jgi:hypothetical protein
MAITQISQIQVRRGLNQDLPQLAGGELGWSTDTRQLYIGNGLLSEGAPVEGVTELLTQYSILDFTEGYAGAVSTLQTQLAALQVTAVVDYNITLPGTSSGTITSVPNNNLVINYSLTQGLKQRTGIIKAAYSNLLAAVTYDEEYTEDATTDISFSFSANTTQVNFNYATTTPTTLLYRLSVQS